MSNKTKPMDPIKALKILKGCHGHSGEKPNKNCTCKDYEKHIHRPIAADQTPIAAILSCSDSRIVPEHIFAAPPGALFVVRTAGNVADTNGIASLEYAVNVLGVRLVIVLGHENCGAVESACNFANSKSGELTSSLYHLIAEIMPVVVGTTCCCTHQLPELEKSNVQHAKKVLKERAEFKFEEISPMVVPAYYKFSKSKSKCDRGEIEWLDDISK